MIRRFTLTDLSAVVALWLEGNRQAHSFIPTSYWENHIEMMKEVLPQAEVYVYVDETFPKVVAFVGLEQNYIAGIFTQQDYRSRGIGSQLLQFLKASHSTLTLSVYLKNEQALRFYQRERFRIVQERLDEQTNEMEYLMEWTASE